MSHEPLYPVDVDLRSRLEAVMGPMPRRDRTAPPRYEVVEEVRLPTYVRQSIRYQTDDGPWTPAFLLVPHPVQQNAGGAARGALALHATDLELGNRIAVGLGGRERRDYGCRMVEEGLVVLAPAYPLMADYQPDLRTLGYVSGTMKAVWDNIRGLDLLASLPGVAGDRMAAMGHSLGGHNALFTATFDPRLHAIVCSCGFDSFRDYMGGDLTGWQQERYMPRLAQSSDPPFDFDDILMSLGERALFISAPLYDNNFSWHSASWLTRHADEFATREASKGITTKQDWVVLHPDCGHDFPIDLQHRAVHFIKEQMRDRADH